MRVHVKNGENRVADNIAAFIIFISVIYMYYEYYFRN